MLVRGRSLQQQAARPSRRGAAAARPPRHGCGARGAARGAGAAARAAGGPAGAAVFEYRELELETGPGISVHNLQPQLRALVAELGGEWCARAPGSPAWPVPVLT
jgi:hypothetical protein